MSEGRIVLPLDGSELSEGALPHAVAIAKATDTAVLLLTIWEEGERALITSTGDAEPLFRKGEEQREAYLAGVAKKLRAEGVQADAEVHIGDPAEEILRVVWERQPHMLVLATHGRSGPSRWWSGSVASRVVREAPVPTLVVGPKVLGDGGRAAEIRRVLVPLDGSPLAETALQPARELAEALGAELVLAQVLRWRTEAFAFGVPDIDIERITHEMGSASEDYLGKVREGLRTQRPVETKVLYGLPADALLELVDDERVDLVVMASHTRSGLARAVLGSVADRMIQGGAPVLVTRPEVLAGVVRPERRRYCHNCGRASPFVQVLPEDRCLRCGQHLHTCGNCVYYDGIGCLLQRPEVHETYPGLNCPQFQFRETEAPQPSETKRKT